MAYWKIPFKSKGGTSYEIQIGGASSNTTLIGGATPIITQEDNSDDFFKPVRTQSGYIQIADKLTNGQRTFNWLQVMPSNAVDRPVYLMQGNEIVWRGYLQPQSFSGQWKEAIQIRQFPIVCSLSALAAFEVETSVYTSINFGGLLYYIFNKLSAWDNSRFWFQSTDALDQWLYKRLIWNNFVQIDDDNTKRGKYNCLELLDHICRFFGWSCRMCGNDVFFCAPEEEYFTDWAYTTLDGFQTIRDGGTASYSTDSWVTYGAVTDKFANNNNTLTFLRGVKKAKVTANINKSDTSVIDFPPKSLRKTISNSSYTRVISDTDKYMFITSNIFSFESRDIMGTGSGTSAEPEGTFNGIERFEGNLLAHEEYDWGTDICIHKSYGNGVYAKLYTNRTHVYPQGKFTLSADIYRGWNKLSNKCTMVMRLGIGHDRSTAKWWNGSEWSSSLSAFTVRIGNDSGIYHLSSSFGTSTGATIPTMHITIPEIMMGYVYVDFLGSNDVPVDNNAQRSFQIENFSLTFTDNVTNSDGQNVYKATGGAFTKEANVDTIFASYKNNQAGDGLIMNEDNTYCELLTFSLYNGGPYSLHPEANLANRIARFWRIARRVYELRLRSNLLPDITPRYQITADGMATWPMVISRNWREDITTLKLIQL